ncbi:MAG: ORF6N domain-containing protein [Acidobacteria bacterium]|nr:ORF6N domain-containing protein [Acidobacteriota bacterium]
MPIAVIEKRIVSVRGHRVMLDSDLAPLYGVTTFNLNKAMKRNRDRFPPDFMFQLTDAEAEDLRFQIGIPRQEGWGGRRYMPFAFTEQGVAMLSSVLRTPHAVQVNVAIMRAFVRLRELMVGNRDLAQRLDALERKYEGRFKKVFDAIRTLMTPPPPPHRTIGFTAGEQS